MSIYLKVKAKSLAAEARIIRKEELKAKRMARAKDPNGGYWHPDAPSLRESLHSHRTVAVRNTARATHLARAYIAGAPYKSVERSTRKAVPTVSIAAMLFRYDNFDSTNAASKAVTKWIET